MPGKTKSNIKKPDVSIRDKKLETLNLQLKKVNDELDLVRKQIDQTQPSSDSQTTKNQLHVQLKDIIKVQSDLKTKKQQIHDKIRTLDSHIKRKTNEIQEKIGKKTQYQSVDQITSRLSQIDQEISSGNLSLVEEKLRVKEMQNLNKLSRDLQQVEPIKKSIEKDRIEISELKQQLGTLNPREISNKFETIQDQINDLQSKNQVVYDRRQKMFAKRTILYKKRDEIRDQISKIRSDFDSEFKAYKKRMEQDRLKREEEQKLSKLLEEKDEQLGKLQEKLIHAKQPAFVYELEAIGNLLAHLDPDYVRPVKKSIEVSEKPAITSSAPVRKVEADDLVLIVKKKDEFFSNIPKGKKGKKKSHVTAQSIIGKFSLEPTVIANLVELDITVPMAKDDVPSTIEQLKSKYEDFLSRQDEQTEKSINLIEEQIRNMELHYSAKEEQVKKELQEKRAREAAEKETEA